MKIVFFEVEKWEEDFFREKLTKHELVFTSEPLTMETANLAQDCAVISIFIYSKISSSLLEKLPSVTIITSRSTGTDHIDKDYCASHAIQVYNVPSYGAHTVAEHTFSLILALTRKIIPSTERTKAGNFHSEGLTGIDLNGKTLGVIGFGNIGSHVAAIGKAFGMTVLAHCRSAKECDGVLFLPFDDVIKKADIITLHVPYTPETHHLINSETLKLCKPGAFIINTARGSIIDTQAMVVALQNGTLAGAGLDVLEEEGAIREERELVTKSHIDLMTAKRMLLGHVLLDMPNVLITPHNAFNSTEALTEINEITIKNILSGIWKKI